MAEQAAGCGAASWSGKTADMPLMTTFPLIGGRIPAPPMPTGGVFASSDPAARYEDDAVQGGDEDEEPYASDDEDDSDSEPLVASARQIAMRIPPPPMPRWNLNHEEEIDVVYEDEDLYETDDEEDGDDSEFEEDDHWPAEFGDGGEADGKEEDPALDFAAFIHHQQARFEFAENTAGFMRIAAAEAETDAGEDSGGDSDSEILVHYRYTLFSRDLVNCRDNGVAVRGGPKLHSFRFLVPSSSAETASSLRLAGAALAHIVYPDHAYQQLRALWSSLLDAAARAPATLPPRAARLDVTVDVGILRRRDSTPGRAGRMLTALPAVARKVDGCPPALRDGDGLVLSLPALVTVDDEGSDDGVRPAKRMRRFAAGEEEECAICWEAMEKKGLAAWPLCSHVFHGRCLEELLVRGDHRCPMCRCELKLELSD